MATIITKNSSTAGAVPLAGDLVQGEIAVNVTDKKLYTKNASGSVVQITPTVNDNGFKNRIINGAMMIDQRNAGASVTQTTSNLYVTDRFLVSGSVTSKFTAQQSSTAPSGFVNSLLITSSSAYTVGASESFGIQQRIEGLNVADFAWGTASAATVTLSFWVRSSLTGTFGGSLRNSAADRSYPFSYTISSANTWEQKTITVAGDQSGTWLTTNGIGIIVTLNMGAGSTVSGTAGAWAGANYVSATGATSVVGTSGATFYITGVQLEKGSTATSFDYRPYGTELALCQRYYYLVGIYGPQALGTGFVYSATEIDMTLTLPVAMRTTPSLSQTTGTNYYTLAGAANKGFTGFSGLQNFSGNTVNLYVTGLSGMTAGQAGMIATTAAGASLGLTAEL